MDRSLHKTRASDGQALLLAVLIMIAILLVGSLFVAVVNYNKRASGRHAQLLTAMSLAEAGIAHANEMLQFSPPGLDWRPSDPPAASSEPPPPGDPVWDYYSTEEIDRGWYGLVDAGTGAVLRPGFTRYPQMGRGHFLLRVTYDPDPPYEEWQEGDPAYINPGSPRPDLLSKYIKIEAIGVTEDEGFVSRKVQAYKPVALANYLLFVSDRSRRGYPTILGYNPWIDMDKDGAAFEFFSPEFAGIPTTYTYNGPIRSNADVEFTGANNGGGLVGASNKILLVNGDANDDGDLNDVGDGATAPITSQDFSNPLWGGYLRDDYFETHGQVTEASLGCVAFDVLTALGPTLEDLTSDRVQEQVDRLSAPDLFARDPATGTMRWDALTCEAGVAVTATAPSPLVGQTHNTAELGWMWDVSGNNQIAGLYIDNRNDIQFAGKINPLMQEWLDPQPDNGGWNALGEVYDKAPAVEIELFPSEDAVREYAAVGYGCATGAVIIVRTTADLIAGPTEGLDLNEIWWPNHNQVDGEPGIRLTRDAADSGDDGGLGIGQWALGDPNYSNRFGEQVGRTMYVDYPAGGRAVIYAEGNIRIKGCLPAENVAGTGRQYHLTVVSGGTIYIDGQILSPQDQYGRDVDGSIPALISDEENTYIALLARDCVVVNPTMLVPQTPGAGTGAVAESDDLGTDPNKHWNLPETQPGASASGSFCFGYPSTNIGLVAYQTMDVNGARLTRPLATSGPPTIVYVQDPSLFPGGTWVTVKAASDLTTSSNLGRVMASSVPGGWVQVESPPGVPFAAGDFLEWTWDPWVSGISLDFYNAIAGTWTPYDFSSDASSEEIFLLTRRDLSDVDWRWEMVGAADRIPMWCPLQQNDATPHWPWSIDIGLNPNPGALNTLRFSLPTGAEIQQKNDDGAPPTPTGIVRDYWLKKFKLQEFDGTDPVGTIHAKINAVMYAQDGCFFVIPGRYFKEDVSAAEAREYLRYNYDVEIRGAITENFHPGPAVVREWQEKWAYPAGADWNSIRYIYDETLLAARTQPLTTLSGVVRFSPLANASWHSNTVKVPLLPASPDLLYYGEVP